MGRKSTLREIDALDLLTRDHDAIKQLFRDYERLIRRHGDDDSKAEIVGQICCRLSIHAQIEEEIFYPAVRAAIGRSGSANHAVCDDGGGKELIAKLDEMEPDDADYDATVAVLSACVLPHMNNEQEQLFPKVRTAGLDTAALGRQLAQCRKALHEDVTRIGLPHSTAGAVTWPAACRVVIA
jgi:hemerythrin superfamily protein